MAHVIITYLTNSIYPSAPNTNGVDKRRMSQNLTIAKKVRHHDKSIPYIGASSKKHFIFENIRKRCGDEWETLKNVNDIDHDILLYELLYKNYLDAAGYFIYKVKNKKDKNSVYSRTSPLVLSDLICTNPYTTHNFGVNFKQGSNPVIHIKELIYGGFMGTLDLDIGSLGVIYSIEQSGYKNIDISKDNKLIEKFIQDGGKIEGNMLIKPDEWRKRMCVQILRTFLYSQGGANMATHYTDTTPAVFVAFVGFGAGKDTSTAFVKDEKSGFYIINPEKLKKLYDSDTLIIDKYGPRGNRMSKYFVGWRPGYPFGNPSVREEIFSELTEIFSEDELYIGTETEAMEALIKDILNNPEWWNIPKGFQKSQNR